MSSALLTLPAHDPPSAKQMLNMPVEFGSILVTKPSPRTTASVKPTRSSTCDLGS